MKKTRMIFSVMLLLLAILIENLYFAAVAIAKGFNSGISEILAHPSCWSIPKVFLLIALVYFVSSSLNDPKDMEKKLENVKTCRKI
jgi:hypothetical protein